MNNYFFVGFALKCYFSRLELVLTHVKSGRTEHHLENLEKTQNSISGGGGHCRCQPLPKNHKRRCNGSTIKKRDLQQTNFGPIFTVRNSFHKRLSFCPRGRCLPLGPKGRCADIPSWADTSPWVDTAPFPVGDEHCSGRYASYWNAFLLTLTCFCTSVNNIWSNLLAGM